MSDLMELLRRGRARERAQTRFYRLLSVEAEAAGDPATAERLNELLADEQHHVSRLTARLLELGGRPEGGAPEERLEVELEGWESEARRREAEEVAWYEEACGSVEDETTRGILDEILASERHHLEELGGKWMAASPGGPAGSPKAATDDDLEGSGSDGPDREPDDDLEGG